MYTISCPIYLLHYVVISTRCYIILRLVAAVTSRKNTDNTVISSTGISDTDTCSKSNTSTFVTGISGTTRTTSTTGTWYR